VPRGRPPKPTRLKLLTGNPGKRPLNDSEPQPAPGSPACPEWLDDAARIEWHRVAPELARLGLLTQVDLAALASYCQAWAEFQAATELIQKEGRHFTSKGRKYPHPAVAHQRSAWKAIGEFSARFGFSPSSRSKLTIAGRPSDEFEAFLAESG
jgi:P27 family predicted phage terminase small subunit